MRPGSASGISENVQRRPIEIETRSIAFLRNLRESEHVQRSGGALQIRFAQRHRMQASSRRFAACEQFDRQSVRIAKGNEFLIETRVRSVHCDVRPAQARHPGIEFRDTQAHARGLPGAAAACEAQ